MPETVFWVVVLPAPFAPRRATISPSRTVNEIPLMAVMAPYRTWRSATSSSVPPSARPALCSLMPAPLPPPAPPPPPRPRPPPPPPPPPPGAPRGPPADVDAAQLRLVVGLQLLL